VRHYKVAQVAELAGVTVRTLHHYDAIGLLSPERTNAGYRAYTDTDILRLQQILVGRELGLPLEAIKAMLDDPSQDRLALLTRQRSELQQRLNVTQTMIRSIDRAIEKLNDESRRPMTIDEIKELFDGFDPDAHEAETKARWGDTAAYKESARRTGSYSKEDWARYKNENAELMAEFGKAIDEQCSAESATAIALAERHRKLIDRWFYPCSHSMHRQLANMYEQDERFAKSFDEFREGLATYLVAAIRANREPFASP